MDDVGDTVDLTDLNDSDMVSDAELAERLTHDMVSDAELAERLQMEELETVNASDFEVAQHLQEMERRNATRFPPEIFMFGEAMRMSTVGRQAGPWRYRPPRPPPPMPMDVSETPNNSEPNAVPVKHPTDYPGEGATSCDAEQGAVSAWLLPPNPSRLNLTRRVQWAMNRNHRGSIPFAGSPNGSTNDAEHSRDADSRREPVEVAATSNVTAARLREAMDRNFRDHLTVATLPNYAATDAEPPRGAANRNRNRNRWRPPAFNTRTNDTSSDSPTRDAPNRNRPDPMAPAMLPTDTAADSEQPYRNVPPPFPPRRQRRPNRNRRTLPTGFDFGLQFPFHPAAGYYGTQRMPGWTPNRRHYEYSQALDEDDGSGNNYEALWELSEQIGEAGNKGLNLCQIARLPTMTHVTPSSTDDTTRDNAASSSPSSESTCDTTLASVETVCRVCLCGFENGELLRALPCCHRFHVDCIDQWIKQNAICPVCRDNIKDHLRTAVDHWNQ